MSVDELQFSVVLAQVDQGALVNPKSGLGGGVTTEPRPIGGGGRTGCIGNAGTTRCSGAYIHGELHTAAISLARPAQDYAAAG